MTYDLTKGKIFPQLISFSLPIFLSLFLNFMYTAVDLAIVGHYATSADVSAISTASQLLGSIIVVAIGLSRGATILIGQAIGAQELKQAERIMGTSIYFFLFLALVITGVLYPLRFEWATLLATPPEALFLCAEYIRINAIGQIFIVSYTLLCCVLCGIGDSRTPFTAVAIACVCNIIGDLILVKSYGLGASGAAWATVISQAISLIFCLCLVAQRGLPFPFSRASLRLSPAIIYSTLKLGLPLAGQDILTSVSFLTILVFVNHLGLTASAGVGIAEKICNFIMLVPIAFIQTISAFVAINVGAKQHARCRAALRCGIQTSLGIGIFLAAGTFYYGTEISAIFAGSDLAVARAGGDYLKAYALDALIVTFLFCFEGYFAGYGRTTFILVQSLIGAIGIRIPLSYYMTQQEPVSLLNIGLASPCSTTVQIILCFIYYYFMQHYLRQMENKGKEK